MLKIKLLRIVLIAFLAVAIALPLYNIFIVSPSFISALKDDSRDKAILTADRLMSILVPGDTELDRAALSVNPDTIVAMIKDSELKKLQIFSASGEILYSTDPKDKKHKNRKKHFNKTVAKGNPYAEIVKKNTEFPDGRTVKADIVETYVPIMKGKRFLGVFGIYYDITVKKNRYDYLRLRSYALLITLAFGLVVLAVINSHRTTRTITERRQVEEKAQLQLNRLNALHSIDRDIASSIDLRSTLDILLGQVTAQLGTDAATILLMNQRTQVLEYAVSRGFRSTALKYTQLKLGESNAGLSALERKIMTITDLKKEPGGFIRSKLFADEGFVTYFAVPLVAKGQVKGVLELFHRIPMDPEPEWLKFLETVADQAAIAIDNATLFDELKNSNHELTLAYDSTIEGWSRTMDMKDKQVKGHAQRVAMMTVRIARKFVVSEEELVHIKRGALLHDIGKIGIPDSILLKPGPLTEYEREIMKRHSVYGYELLYPIKFLRPALDIIYYHHERWDGTGYPKRLKGDEIPLSARIFAVADVWDALRSDRPFRSAWPKEKVLEHIRSLSGTHFDPKAVEVFLSKVEW